MNSEQIERYKIAFQMINNGQINKHDLDNIIGGPQNRRNFLNWYKRKYNTCPREQDGYYKIPKTESDFEFQLNRAMPIFEGCGRVSWEFAYKYAQITGSQHHKELANTIRGILNDGIKDDKHRVIAEKSQQQAEGIRG